MGSIPEVSIIKGQNRDYSTKQLLHRIFEANLNASHCGNDPAVIFSDRIDGNNKLTYTQLNQAANRMAATLIHQINASECEPNQDGDWIVAVCLPPSNELIITLLAILKTGAAYLPLDVTFPKSRIDHILQEAKPALVIFDENAIERSSFSYTTVLSFSECKAFATNYDSANISDEQMLQSANALAVVLYTSGSTGVPKGVRLPHAVLMNRLQWQWETFPYSSTEKIGVFKTALTFVDSISEIWGPLLTKRAVLVVPKCVTKDPTQLVAILQKYEIERLVLVPTLLKSLLIYLSLKNDANLLSKLKLWVCSGETLPVSLANEFYDYFPENEYLLCNFYGSTEIMGDVTYFICRGKSQLRNCINVPIGYPIFNNIIYILDGERKPVKVGETGELFVSGANLAHGYVKGRDKERFIENVLAVDPRYGRMYQTGDYASVQKGGIIHYEGRTDSQVKIRGHRVDLSEIEKNLLEIKGVQKGVVLCYHAGRMDQAILAFASVDAASHLHELQIEKILRNKLPEYMTPQVIIVDQVPLLVNQKIDRQKLLKMYENTNNNDDPEPAVDYDYTGISKNERAKAQALFETIGEVIGRMARAAITLDSNFYALGGNSLNSIYTVAKLRERGFCIDISNFISAANLKEILDYMTKMDETPKKTIVSSENKGKFVVMPLQMEHKAQTIHIISNSFLEKAELEQQLKPNIKYSDYTELLNAIWQPLVQKGYSFVIKNESNHVIGVALNFDANDEPEAPVTGPLSIIFEFLDFVEVPIKNKLPKDKPILHSFMMGTHESLNAQENVVAMTFMEGEVIRMAKKRNCCGILTTNTNALTQQLARNVFGYETLLDYQVNQYINNGKKPFGSAPDSYRAIVQWKEL